MISTENFVVGVCACVWDGLQCHNVNTTLHESRSTCLKVERENTHTHTKQLGDRISILHFLK